MLISCLINSISFILILFQAHSVHPLMRLSPMLSQRRNKKVVLYVRKLDTRAVLVSEDAETLWGDPQGTNKHHTNTEKEAKQNDTSY